MFYNRQHRDHLDQLLCLSASFLSTQYDAVVLWLTAAYQSNLRLYNIHLCWIFCITEYQLQLCRAQQNHTRFINILLPKAMTWLTPTTCSRSIMCIKHFKPSTDQQVYWSTRPVTGCDFYFLLYSLIFWSSVWVFLVLLSAQILPHYFQLHIFRINSYTHLCVWSLYSKC